MSEGKNQEFGIAFNGSIEAQVFANPFDKLLLAARESLEDWQLLDAEMQAEMQEMSLHDDCE